MRVNREGTLDVLRESEADLRRLISRFICFSPLGCLGYTHLGDTSQTNYDISRSSVNRDFSFLSFPPGSGRASLEPAPTVFVLGWNPKSKTGYSKWMGGRSVS